MSNQFVDAGNTQNEMHWLNLLTYIPCGLSIFGTLFVGASYLLFPRLRTIAFEFVVMLGLSNLLSNLAWLIKPPQLKSPALCTTQAFFLTYGASAENMWVVCIANTINMVLVQPDPCAKTSKKALGRLRWWAHLICWSVPLCISLLPLTTAYSSNLSGSYEPGRNESVSYVCWITTTDFMSMGFIMFFLILNIFQILYILFVYCRTAKLLKALDVSSTEFFLAGEYDDYSFRPSYITKARLKYYPVISLLQNLVYWAYFFFYYHFRSFELFLAFSFVRNIGGLLNSVIYGCTEIVYNEWSRNMNWGRSYSNQEYRGFQYSEIVDRNDEFARMPDNFDPNRIDKRATGQLSNSEAVKAPSESEVID